LRNFYTNKVATVGKELSSRTWAGDITNKIKPDVVGQHWKALPCIINSPRWKSKVYS
jgi:hypothetical protein